MTTYCTSFSPVLVDFSPENEHLTTFLKLLCYFFLICFILCMYRRPTALQDWNRYNDDDDYQHRDYDVAELANNLSQSFQYGIYNNEDNDQVFILLLLKACSLFCLI